MAVLVIGGAGFVGSHLVDELLTQKMEVMVVDNLSTGKMENLARWKNNMRLDFVKADADDSFILQRIVDHKSWVFNFAPISVDSLFDSCVQSNVKRLIDNTCGWINKQELNKDVSMVSLSIDSIYGPRGPFEGSIFVSDVVKANMRLAMDRSFEGMIYLKDVIDWSPIDQEAGKQIIDLFNKNSHPSIVIASR